MNVPMLSLCPETNAKQSPTNTCNKPSKQPSFVFRESSPPASDPQITRKATPRMMGHDRVRTYIHRDSPPLRAHTVAANDNPVTPKKCTSPSTGLGLDKHLLQPTCMRAKPAAPTFHKAGRAAQTTPKPGWTTGSTSKRSPRVQASVRWTSVST